MKHLVFFLIILLLSSCISNSKSKPNSSDAKTDAIVSERSEELVVSLVKLIATPEKYDGKTIQLVGYLNLEFESNAIYLHREDYEHGLTQNGFWVEFSKSTAKAKKLSDYSKKYVIIIGRFTMKQHGHMGLFSGKIQDISRLDTWQ